MEALSKIFWVLVDSGKQRLNRAGSIGVGFRPRVCSLWASLWTPRDPSQKQRSPRSPEFVVFGRLLGPLGTLTEPRGPRPTMGESEATKVSPRPVTRLYIHIYIYAYTYIYIHMHVPDYWCGPGQKRNL